MTDFSVTTSLNKAVIPRTTNKLKMFEPMMFDTDKSEDFWMDAVILTAASGADVPKATKVSPMMIVGMRKNLAILELPSTKKSAPLISKIKPTNSNM